MEGQLERCIVCSGESRHGLTSVQASTPDARGIERRGLTSFCQAKEKADRQKAAVVVNQSHTCHTNAPEDHGDRYEDTGSVFLKQDLRQWFKQTVTYEEDCQAVVVLWFWVGR